MDWKKIGKSLLFPPPWLLVVLTAASGALLVTVFQKGWDETPVAYAVYVLSFYTLTVDCMFCAAVLPKGIGSIRQKLYGDPRSRRYMTDRVLRSKLSLYLSAFVSLLYVGLNLWSWHRMQSWWFGVLAVYYGILALIRVLLADYTRKNQLGADKIKEWRNSRRCAWILLLVNLTLSGAVLMILYQDKGYDYPGMMIYVMALYSFYSITHAIVDIVKFRKLGSPILSTAKVVSLSAALVSMLNLETAMFAQFGGEMSEETQRIFIILTGAGISAAVVVMSAVLARKATIEIRRNKHGK